MRAICEAFVRATAEGRDVAPELRVLREELLGAFSNVLRGLDGEHGISIALRLAERVLEDAKATPGITPAHEHQKQETR